MDKIFETAKEIGCLLKWIDKEVIGKEHLKEWQGGAKWKASLLAKVQ